MGIEWTKEQQQVISLRDRSILVSAAAGSGKTAVLVQRIISMILDEKHPIDVDRLLIMTFTRAAAGEMKTRLSQALEAALEEDPDNPHLLKQTSLIHSAQITTIHGFCSYVLRNYFQMVDLDPGFRVADEGELKLLKKDVMKKVLEQMHEEKRPEFLRLLAAYAPGKTDQAVEDMILRIYEFSQSAPWPEEWLERAGRFYEEEWYFSGLMERMWEETLRSLQQVLVICEKNLRLCGRPDGPELYEASIRDDMNFIKNLMQAAKENQYELFRENLQSHSYMKLSGKKMPDASDEIKEQVKSNRNQVKSILTEMKESYFAKPIDEILKQLSDCRAAIQELVLLVKIFAEQYQAEKKKKNLIDFSDMEHFALKILAEKDGDEYRPTAAAKELSEKYQEIMIDEYQDSNLVQEKLMQQVSGKGSDEKNIFMVGDVKQSIYRFRLARPELFMDKYARFSKTEAKEQRIDLSRNFRSREEVLRAINYIFRKLMGRELGGIEYDAAAALYCGAVYPEKDQRDITTELILLDTEEEEPEEKMDTKEAGKKKGSSGKQSEKTAAELEALAIAMRIKELKRTGSVFDRKTDSMRGVEYDDIAILLRSTEGMAEEFTRVLMEQGIPVYSASKTGYFSTNEIIILLNYLRICDNFRQEIPLASALRSCFGNVTAEELAILKKKYPDKKIYEQVTEYLEEQRFVGSLLYEKLERFMNNLKQIREAAAYTPIHQLIIRILGQSDYLNYVGTLPGGEQRRANVEMLVEKAMEYEKTSYRGLFNFVRYIENLQKYEIDFGEVNLGGGESSVQMMTIHKSKGLEFPIVFVSGLGKQFNQTDSRDSLLMDAELGIGIDWVDFQNRVKETMLPKKMLQEKIKRDNYAEELRVLYVALTRAKEKLILTGKYKKIQPLALKLKDLEEQTEELLPYSVLMSANGFWEWILPALCRHRSMNTLYDYAGLSPVLENAYYGQPDEFDIRIVTPAMLVQEQITDQITAEMRRRMLKELVAQEGNPEIQQELQERFEYQYPYREGKDIPAKVSVSELKKKSWEDESAVVLAEPEELIPVIPNFIKLDEEVEHVEIPVMSGAARGTAYHKILECLDYESCETTEQIQEQIQKLLEKNLLTREEAAVIRTGQIIQFAKSPIGKRMRHAFEKGCLKREQPFVMKVSAREVNKDWPEEQEILVQGIIDAWFLEEDEMVLVDYKTDSVRPGEEEILVKRYQTQLEYYAGALEKITGKHVKEKVIYSVSLHKSICV